MGKQIRLTFPVNNSEIKVISIERMTLTLQKLKKWERCATNEGKRSLNPLFPATCTSFTVSSSIRFYHYVIKFSDA